MKLPEVKEIAKEMGISLGKMNKSQLIHSIQTKEGNFPCFGTAVECCDQDACLWREDCLGA